MALFKNKLKIGNKAPDFSLPSHLGGKVRLSDYKGRKNVLLAFYPMDWTPICTNQIPSYENELHRFDSLDCQVMAVSVDSIPCHQAWQKSIGGITYPLLSDYSPHGEVSKKYGVLTDSGYAERAVFVIDKEGIVRFIDFVGVNNIPENEKIFKVLAQL